jgi:hypothetical protein
MSRMNQSFKGYYCIFNAFGHKANQYKSIMYTSQFGQRNVVCHTCNKPRHISKFYKNKIGRQFDLEQRNMSRNRVNYIDVRKEMEKV